jgi:hypothetical protein
VRQKSELVAFDDVEKKKKKRDFARFLDRCIVYENNSFVQHHSAVLNTKQFPYTPLTDAKSKSVSKLKHQTSHYIYI